MCVGQQAYESTFCFWNTMFYSHGVKNKYFEPKLINSNFQRVMLIGVVSTGPEGHMQK